MKNLCYLLVGILFLFSCQQTSQVKDDVRLSQYDSINTYLKQYEIGNATRLWQQLDSNLAKDKRDSIYWMHQQMLVQILLNENYFDSAKAEIMDVLSQIDTLKYEAIYINLKRLQSVSELQLGSFNESITHAYEVLPYYEQNQNFKRVCSLKASISWAYFNIMNWEMSKKYILESIALAQKENLVDILPDYYQRLATIFAGQLQYDTLHQYQKFDSAIFYYDKSLSLLDTTEASWDLSNLYLNKGSLYTLMHLDELSIASYQKALSVNERINDEQGIANCNNNLGLTYINMQKYDLAEDVLLKAEKIAERMKDYNLLTSIHKNLAVLYKKTKKYESASNYFEKYVTTFFVEVENKNTAQSKALSEKYEKEKTAKEIQLYKNEQLLSQYKLMGLTALLFFFILIAAVVVYVFIQRIKNKKIIDQINLAHEKKMIEQITKENERTRISRNLHDNLGAYASSILNKIYLIENDLNTNVKEQELVELKFTAQQILSNLKSIVVDLNQQSLPFLEFLDMLKTELMRLFNSYPQIDFNINDNLEFNELISPEAQFDIKSIVFEMVNNAIKHSTANAINFNIHEVENSIGLSVLDNGKYNSQMLKANGNGLSNIRTRLLNFDGSLEINENSTGGTAVVIQLMKSTLAAGS